MPEAGVGVTECTEGREGREGMPKAGIGVTECTEGREGMPKAGTA